jgi:hypothetical protein
VGEVEAQALRFHQRAGLLDVVAQVPPQHRLEQVGGGVMAHDAPAARGVHGQMRRVVDVDDALLHLALVDDEVVGQLLGIGNPDAPAVAGDFARVPHLAAGFAVEGSGLGNHLHLLAGLGLVIVPGRHDEGQDGAVAFQGVVAQEFSGRPLRQLLVDRGNFLSGAAFPGLPGGRPLHPHVLLKAFQVQHQALFPQGVLDQVQGKAVGVVELEGHLPGQDLLAVGLEVVQFFAQQPQAVVQGVGESALPRRSPPGS